MNGDHSFTLEGWFKKTTTIQSQMLVALPGGPPVGLGIWHVQCNNSPSASTSTILLDEYGISNCWDTGTAGVNLYDGSWHYVAVTYDQSSGTVTGYVDGHSLGPVAVARPFDFSTGLGIYVGNWVDSAFNLPFIGDAAQIAVYPSALSNGRINAHYAAAGYSLSSDATLNGLSFSAGAISPAFSASATAYTLTVPNATSSTTLTATAADGHASLSLTAPSAGALSSGVASSAIPLGPGETTITVHILAADGVTSKDYTVTVTRVGAAQALQFTSTAPSAAKAGGQPYTPTASATSGLPVAITLDAGSSGCTLAGGVVTFTTVGACLLDANQAGNTSWAPASQVQQQIAVGRGTQTISFSSKIPVPAVIGASYTPAAAATSGLTVTIALDGSSSGCTLAVGVVKFTALGTCVLDANQSGNASFTAAAEVQQQVTVTKAPQTITFTSIAPSATTADSPTYTPVASSSSGLAVTITLDGASSGCALNGGIVTFTGPGSCVLDANQAGNSTYAAATQAQQTIAVGAATQTIAFGSTNPSPVSVGATYTPKATASSGLPVAFTLDSSSVGCTLTVGIVSFTTAGSCVLDANQAGNTTYAPAAQVQQTITVVPAATDVTATLSGSSVLYEGLTSTYTLGVDNPTKTAVAAGGTYTVNISNPYAVPTITASGDGWSCANIPVPARYGKQAAAGGSTDVVCTDSSAIGSGGSSTPLSLALTPNPTSASSLDHGVLLSPKFSSAAGDTLSEPLPLPLDIVVPERASPALAISGPAKLGLVSTAYSISLANHGAGATTGPSTVTLAVPSGVTAHGGLGTGWHCGAPTATSLTCSESQALGSGVGAAKLLVALSGKQGSANTVALTASVSTNDLAGSLSAAATLPVTLPVQVPAPALQFAQQAAPASDPTDEARYTLQIANQGGGPGALPLTVTEQLPPGLTVQTAGSGWSCTQAPVIGNGGAASALILSCSYTASAELASGAQTAPLQVTLAGTNAFAGGAVPLTTTVALDALNGAPEGTTANEALGIPPLTAAVTTAILTTPSPTVSPGATEQLTFGMANYSAGEASGPYQIALALPAGLSVASVGAPTPDRPLPAAGSKQGRHPVSRVRADHLDELLVDRHGRDLHRASADAAIPDDGHGLGQGRPPARG